MKTLVLKRAEMLREAMAKEGGDAFVIITDEGANWQSLYYMSGFRGTSGALVLYRDGAELMLDARYSKQGGEQSPYTVTVQNEGLTTDVKESLKKHGAKVVYCQAANTYHSVWESLTGYEAEWLDGTEHICSLRRRKDETEIGCIRKAGEIAAAAFMDSLNHVRAGMTELEFEALLNYKINGHGGGTSPGMIVASGKRSALPHGRATGKAMLQGEWVTVDFSAVYRGYFCDVTRNFAIGAPDARALEYHGQLLKAQEEAVKLLRAGAVGTDVHNRAREALADAGISKYFVHGLGHGLGIEIHEAPMLSSRKRDVLAAGDVVTVEPGVYIDGWGGLRVEDDYVVGENGCELLTNELHQCFYLIK